MLLRDMIPVQHCDRQSIGSILLYLQQEKAVKTLTYGEIKQDSLSYFSQSNMNIPIESQQATSYFVLSYNILDIHSQNSHDIDFDL